MRNTPSPERAVAWFDPRRRNIGSWAFILNRITGLGLLLYLLMHLIALGQLVQGPQAYDGFIALVHNPLFTLGELLVIAACLIHGLNGIRIALNSLGVGVRAQAQTFIAILVVAVALTLFFAIHMLA